MPTGVVLFPNPHAVNVVDDVTSQASRAHDIGVRQVWLGQQHDHDAIALAGLVGAVVRGLGLGLGAHEPERLAFGISWGNTITRLREHLTVLRSIFNTGAVDFSSNEITAQPGWPVRGPGGTPVPVFVAAMGPKALRVGGELADGTLPYLAGPRTIAEFIEPVIAKSAADAGRPKPGLASAADLAAVGSAESVRRQLQSYLDAGATDVVLSGLAWSDAARAEELWAVAASL